MVKHWTFGQRMGAGFAVMVVLTAVISVVSVYALRSTVTSKDFVIDVRGASIVRTHEAALQQAREASTIRGYLIEPTDARLLGLSETRTEFDGIVARLKQAAQSDEERRLIERMERAEAAYRAPADRLMALRKSGEALERVAQGFEDELAPLQREVAAASDELLAYQERTRDQVKEASTAAAAAAVSLIMGMALAAILAAIVAAIFLSRALGRQIGSAVGQVQSSSTELQAAANQQATGAKEQATAMSKIATTISELLATSRQIAESAQRVAHIAEQTAASARTGDANVMKSNDAVAGIRRQVDAIVNHMLELGKKSQQIGAVLDIVSELAEQTNILAINATIEAASAGEAGKRFAVVADEIRKLADRVAVSTKEIRSLIEDVRGAVNTTVMTTEGGSKAVDAGMRQFTEVASAFGQIADLVSTTTDAAREIGLSTKQQTTAVEQVNIAIANVAQATKENEASSMQTLQTASQLAVLSNDLLRLVRPRLAA